MWASPSDTDLKSVGTNPLPNWELSYNPAVAEEGSPELLRPE